jgi:hypothetical protein
VAKRLAISIHGDYCEHSGVGLVCLSVTITLQPLIDPSSAVK